MRRLLTVLLLLPVLLTAACETTKNLPRADVVSFDRGVFSLGYADLTGPAKLRCEKDPNTPACIKFLLLDAQVRQAIIDAPKQAAAAAAASSSGGVDFSQAFSLLMSLAPLLAGS